MGASKWVPACSPPSNQFQYQAGPLSSERLISCVFQFGVLANGGGSWIIGVRSDSGWVRSMMSIEPEMRPSTNAVRLSSPAAPADASGAERAIRALEAVFLLIHSSL